MSSGVKGGASRVIIPSGVKKTIEDIKEITGQNHPDDEIYAMLKECSMDPNEATQKLLQLDTFHEVKRKRDKRKEVQNLNSEPAESKWKQGNQPRASRVGRGNYSSRYASHDSAGGRNSSVVKENFNNHHTDKIIFKMHSVTPKDVRKDANYLFVSPITALSNGASDAASVSTNVTHDGYASSRGGVNEFNKTANRSKSEALFPSPSTTKSIKNHNCQATDDTEQLKMMQFSSTPASIPSATDSGYCFSSFDPALLSSQNFPLPTSVARSQGEGGSEHATSELIGEIPMECKLSSAKLSTDEVGILNFRKKMSNDLHEVEKNQHLEPMPIASSTVGVSTGSRPSSNYNDHSQVIGLQKGTEKEWKPESMNASNAQGVTTATTEVSTIPIGSHPEPQTAPTVLASKEANIEVPRKLQELNISDRQHVIIPYYLHVPEVEKLGFCFGSFDASFGLDMNHNCVRTSDDSPPPSESSEATDEPVNEQQLSSQSLLATVEDSEERYHDQPQSPSQGTKKFVSNDVVVSSSISPVHSESKPEFAPGNHHHSMVHSSSNYNLGFMPQMLAGQLTSWESSDSQACDPRQHPGFVVPQSFDPASYYAQFYRSGLDSDGRISLFHSAGAANKCNGNTIPVSTQTSQTPQDFQGGIPVVSPTASLPPLVTQAAGVILSSANQQLLPVLRQPTGVYLPHYPPNFIPYGPYFSPFYVPPPAIHQFWSSGAFPQQPQASSVYPTPPETGAKFSVSQYKQGSNTGSSHVGVLGNYGLYGLSMTQCTSPTAAITSCEDILAPQIKENNAYVISQQNDGSHAWFTTPGQDISALQASSFYNLPQGQLSFAPTQPVHGAFTGIFHPAQPVTTANGHLLPQQAQATTNAANMVHPTASVYQQPQLNWPSNY